MKLYHGTSYKNALSILANGFDFNRAGENYGLTYGKGIYFSPNYDEAKFYAENDGIVLSFNIEIKPYYLIKDKSVSRHKKIKIPDGYNCIVSPNKIEYCILYFI